jgi:hypothetical protein
MLLVGFAIPTTAKKCKTEILIVCQKIVKYGVMDKIVGIF